jgi:cell pole-organizing protein PopZ
MAQASSAQREPSMEEILASIRRIIEDSDAVQRQPEVTPIRPANDVARAAPAPTPAAVISAAPTPSAFAPPAPPERREPLPEVEAFRQELTVAKVPSPSSVLSMSDVHAMVAADRSAAREAAERAYRENEVAAPAPVQKNESPAATRPADDWRLGVAPTQAPSEEDVDLGFDEAITEALEELDADRAVQPAAEPVEPVADTALEIAASRPTILSDHAERQVAAAFGELADAFASRSKRTLESMAEDLMRPMLQEWLDNNLPLLVERLVREEIERVARGS